MAHCSPAAQVRTRPDKTVGSGTERFVRWSRARRSQTFWSAPLRKNRSTRARRVRGRALVRWWKGVRGGALLARCAGSDTSGHDGGIGHGTILPGWPRTQVTGFLECAAAQNQKHSDTMTARPRTS